MSDIKYVNINKCGGCIYYSKDGCDYTGGCIKAPITIHSLDSHLCTNCEYLGSTGCTNGMICVEGRLFKDSRVSTEDRHLKLPAKKEMVNHPAHYQGKNGIEVIDVIEAFTANLSGVEAFDAANMIKYSCRWIDKNGIEDLEKVIWYANHLINHIKNK